jgi:uncharacterized OB-fold protein
MMSNLRPLPEPTPESKPFWDACRDGKLVLQHCKSCGEVNWFPRGLCRFCAADNFEWVASNGRGTVYSFSVITRASDSGIPTPYVLALVDLEEGPRLMTHIIECAPATVAIDMPVEVRFQALTEEVSLPVFAPVAIGE